MSETDIMYMRQALSLARRNLGQTWPNPAVGAVVVKNNEVIGIGYTARGGRPHAEPQALLEAGANAKGATLYISLEPCAHHGKTPPCTDAIIASGIARCVIACRDPNPPVNGKGIALLQAAGIDITENICKEEALDLNRGFISAVERKRPFVALKIATSSDGKIAGGPTRWITGEASRDIVHRMRSEYDAVLTGIGTVLADDPMLNVRIPGLENKSPVRVILDRNHRLPDHSKIAQTMQDIPTWIFNTQSAEEALSKLADKGITRVLVEAGQRINTALVKGGLADRIYWFKAPTPIGETGLDAFEPGTHFPAEPRWQKLETQAIAADQLEIWDLKA